MPTCPPLPPQARSPSSEWFSCARRGWFPPRRHHRPQYPQSSLIVGKAAANLGKELVHIAKDCHHTGSAPGQFVSLSLSAEEEKGDSEVQLCLCLWATTMFPGQLEPIYSTVKRMKGGGKQSISYRPNISVLYLFQGEGRAGDGGAQALVWKTGQDELAVTDPRRPHQDLADIAGLLTEDSILKTLAARYHRCQYWVTVSKLLEPFFQHSISDPHRTRAIESPPPWTPAHYDPAFPSHNVPRVHVPRHRQLANPAGDRRIEKRQVFHHMSASLLSCWSGQE